MISQIIWAAIVTILCVVITGCGQNEVQEPSASEQVNEAKQEVDEAREELKDAKQELREEKREENYADNKREFGNEIELRITKNEDRFADLRWELDKSERNYEEKDGALSA